MKITIDRKIKNDYCSIGELYIDGIYECLTLEDKERGANEPKIFGATAIPLGNYRVIIDHSCRFNAMMPHILNVPGGQIKFGDQNIDACGVRIHSGNVDTDTEGCILLGMRQGTIGGKAAILDSRVAFVGFFTKLQRAIERGETCELEIRG